MGIKSYISLSIASVAVLAGAGAAQAAALQGRVGINPPSPTPGGEQTGVSLTGTGLTAPNGAPLTDIDFVPPAGGGIGPIVELNANPLPTGENDFQPFVGQTGTIQDLLATQLISVTTGDATIPGFITIPGAFSIELTDFEFPDYSFDGTGTTISFGLTGNFFNLSDGSNDVSQGVGSASVDFAGFTIAETQALFDEPGETPTAFNPGTWSSNWVVTAQDIPDVPPTPPIPGEQIPEASNLLGLLVIGLGGATMIARKKK